MTSLVGSVLLDIFFLDNSVSTKGSIISEDQFYCPLVGNPTKVGALLRPVWTAQAVRIIHFVISNKIGYNFATSCKNIIYQFIMQKSIVYLVYHKNIMI